MIKITPRFAADYEAMIAGLSDQIRRYEAGREKAERDGDAYATKVHADFIAVLRRRRNAMIYTQHLKERLAHERVDDTTSRG